MRLRSVSIVSSLPLQRLLHFNSYYSVFYAAAEIGLTVFKLTSTVLDEKMKYSLPVLVAIFVLSELARLPLGYTGNLREKVSELSAFWLLSLFPQLPLVAYLTIGQIYTGGFLPLDLAAGICLLAMLLGELYYGYSAIKTFIRKQTADFSRLCQEDALLGATAVASGGMLLVGPSVASQIGAYGTALLHTHSSRSGSSRGAPQTSSARHQQQPPASPAPASAPAAVAIDLSSASATPSVGGIAALGARHLVSVASSFMPSTSSSSTSSGAPIAPRQRRTGGGAAADRGVEMTSTTTTAASSARSKES